MDSLEQMGSRDNLRGAAAGGSSEAESTETKRLLFLAMACEKLGMSNKARDALQTVPLLESDLPEGDVLSLLWREVRAVVKAEPGPSSPSADEG
jgi:hypothetical protein